MAAQFAREEEEVYSFTNVSSVYVKTTNGAQCKEISSSQVFYSRSSSDSEMSDGEDTMYCSHSARIGGPCAVS